MANVKYYINGRESNSITLSDSDSTNSIDVQVLDESAPAPTDFIFKQFVKVTEQSKWTENVRNAVDEKGAIAFLPFKDTGTGKNQIYAQGSYFGGGLDSSDVDASAASFQDNTGKTMILTVGSDGKLRFVSYKAIARTTQTGGATFEFDSKKSGGTVNLSATFNKEFTSSGWGDGATNNQKSGLSQTATGTYVSNTNKTWNLTVTETVGDPSNSNTKATASASQSVTFWYKGNGYFWGSTNEITVTSPADGITLTPSSGTTSTITYGNSSTAVPTTCNKPNTGATTPYLYIFVKGDLAESNFSYKVNGGLAASVSRKVGTFTAYSTKETYSLFVFVDKLPTDKNATLAKA